MTASEQNKKSMPKTISPLAALSKITKRLAEIERRGRPVEFKKYISGKDYKTLYFLLDEKGCQRVMDAVQSAKRSCFQGREVPKTIPYKISWKDPANVQRLRELEAKYGDDYEIARAWGVPLRVIRPARWKYCGRRRYRDQPHSEQATATREAA